MLNNRTADTVSRVRALGFLAADPAGPVLIGLAVVPLLALAHLPWLPWVLLGTLGGYALLGST
jgi:hypothetical protein